MIQYSIRGPPSVLGHRSRPGYRSRTPRRAGSRRSAAGREGEELRVLVQPREVRRADDAGLVAELGDREQRLGMEAPGREVVEERLPDRVEEPVPRLGD